MNKYCIFIHAALLEKCNERIMQYYEIIKNSNLLETIENIFISYVGEDEKYMLDIDNIDIEYKQKIKIVHISKLLSDYEIPTLQLLHEFCNKNPTYNVLYLHTKNVGKNTNLCIEDQINYMLYFNVEQWKKCFEKLLYYNTTSVDLQQYPTLHYSGNFWWANASYILSLPSPILFNNLEKYPNPLNSLRHNQEFWICFDKKAKHFSLWDCEINCYERHLHRYSKKMYSI